MGASCRRAVRPLSRTVGRFRRPGKSGSLWLARRSFCGGQLCSAGLPWQLRIGCLASRCCARLRLLSLTGRPLWHAARVAPVDAALVG